MRRAGTGRRIHPLADLIVVVDDTRIVGPGSHDELMAAKGLNADLYEQQARAYR